MTDTNTQTARAFAAEAVEVLEQAQLTAADVERATRALRQALAALREPPPSQRRVPCSAGCGRTVLAYKRSGVCQACWPTAGGTCRADGCDVRLSAGNSTGFCDKFHSKLADVARAEAREARRAA